MTKFDEVRMAKIDKTIAKTKKRNDHRYGYKLCIDDYHSKMIYGTSRAKLKKNVHHYIATLQTQEEQKNNPTLSSLAKTFLEETIRQMNCPGYQESKKWKYNTKRNYYAAYHRILNGFPEYGIDGLGEIRIQDLDYQDIAFFVEQVECFRSGSTVQRYQTLIKKLCHYAVMHKYVPISPYHDIDFAKKDSAPITAPPKEELRIIQNSLDCPFGLYAYVQLFTGMRRGEVLGLRWEDINWDKQELKVKRTVVFKTYNHSIVNSPKTAAGTRDIHMTDNLSQVLSQYQTQSHQSNGYLFYTSDTTIPMTRHEFDRNWKDYTNATGLTDLHTHQLRHAFTNMCCEQNISTDTIKHWLGHGSINTTMNIYRDFKNGEISQKDIEAVNHLKI